MALSKIEIEVDPLPYADKLAIDIGASKPYTVFDDRQESGGIYTWTNLRLIVPVLLNATTAYTRQAELLRRWDGSGGTLVEDPIRQVTIPVPGGNSVYYLSALTRIQEHQKAQNDAGTYSAIGIRDYLWRFRGDTVTDGYVARSCSILTITNPSQPVVYPGGETRYREGFEFTMELH